MKHISKYIAEKFGSGESGKADAAKAFGKSQATIYNWCNSDDHFVFSGNGVSRVIKVKSEMIEAAKGELKCNG